MKGGILKNENNKNILSLTVLAVLWCADGYAHTDGGPVAHLKSLIPLLG